jgi:hypothetical protein
MIWALAFSEPLGTFFEVGDEIECATVSPVAGLYPTSLDHVLKKMWGVK